MRKALTITAPWAWAIVNAGKRVENRTWRTRHRGTILIHAGLKDRRDERAAVEAIIGRSMPAEIPKGVIVARAQLVDVVPAEQLDDTSRFRAT